MASKKPSKKPSKKTPSQKPGKKGPNEKDLVVNAKGKLVTKKDFNKDRFEWVSSFVSDLILAEEKLLEKTGWTRHFAAGTFSTWTNPQFSTDGRNTMWNQNPKLMVYSRNQAILLTKASMADLGLN